MDVQDTARVGMYKKWRQDTHKSRKHNQRHTVRIQLLQKRTFKRIALRIVPADHSNGGDSLLPCTFERIGICLISDDHGNLRVYTAILNSGDNRGKIGAAARTENAKFLLTHQRHRP